MSERTAKIKLVCSEDFSLDWLNEFSILQSEAEPLDMRSQAEPGNELFNGYNQTGLY